MSLLGCQTNKTKESPNVAIIFIDDMDFADPSCFGNPMVKVLNIDVIAENELDKMKELANRVITWRETMPVGVAVC